LFATLKAGSMTDSRAISAAGNNADIYECVFQAHDLRYRREAYAFISIDPPPPYYSSLTTLSATRIDEQRAAIDQLRRSRSWKFDFKDSFCSFDMTALGMEILFEARWLWAPPRMFGGTDPNWQQVKTDDDLAQWEQGWKRNGSSTERKMFPSSMLSRPDIVFFGRRNGAGFQAGCIGNISGDCVGLSNVFSESDGEDELRAAIECVAALAPDKPVVGYDRGAMLSRMKSFGFEDVGPLRIWRGKQPL
jgi:hypothetical protein